AKSLNQKLNDSATTIIPTVNKIAEQNVYDISFENFTKILKKIDKDEQQQSDDERKDLSIKLNLVTPVIVFDKTKDYVIPIEISGEQLKQFEEHMRNDHNIDETILDEMKHSDRPIECGTNIKLQLTQCYATVTETPLFDTYQQLEEFNVEFEKP
ncbi:hypothetical protein BLA29_013402, partial [Euroglyphus maynei]